MIIRQAVPEDAGAFLELLRQLDQETEFMMMEPGERTSTSDDLRNQIINLRNSGSVLLLLFEGTRAAGFLSAQRNTPARMRHSAYLAMGIRKEYRRKGYGECLLKELFCWAEKENVTRLELTVMTHNQTALHLYQKMGFQIEGTLIRSMRIRDSWVDQYSMAKLF